MTAAEVTIDTTAARFTLGGTQVGRYVLDDDHKPYLHPLRTPGGRVVTLAKPSDHRHHKGLMYALTATDVNWWEETPVEGYVDTAGVQRILGTHIDRPGALRQTLLWTADDGTRESFREERRIACAGGPDGVVRWTWSADFEVLRDVTLRFSIWAEDRDGRRTNYHGLGIRFPREFGYVTDWSRWSGDGLEGPEALTGARPESITVTDRVDGEVPAPEVSVRVSQVSSRHACFALCEPAFCYLSIGPTVANDVVLKAGDRFHEEYVVEVADGDLAGGARQ